MKNAPVTDAHRQKCADLANEASGDKGYQAHHFEALALRANVAFAQYVANTEAREAKMLDILSDGTRTYLEMLDAIRAILTPVDPFVLEAERRLGEGKRMRGGFEARHAEKYLEGDWRQTVSVQVLAAALRENTKA